MLLKILSDFFTKGDDEEKAIIIIGFMVILVIIGLVIAPLTLI